MNKSLSKSVLVGTIALAWASMTYVALSGEMAYYPSDIKVWLFFVFAALVVSTIMSALSIADGLFD